MTLRQTTDTDKMQSACKCGKDKCRLTGVDLAMSSKLNLMKMVVTPPLKRWRDNKLFNYWSNIYLSTLCLHCGVCYRPSQ
jgi:hypothetical protein